MSYSNQTANLGLPQWSGSDKPTYLVDQNTAYLNIDNFAGDTQDDISQLNTDLNTISGRTTTLESKQATDETNITGLQSSMATVQTSVASMGVTITNLGHDVNTAQSDIDTLEGSVNTLTGTTIPAIQSQTTATENQLSSDGTAQGTKFYFDIQNGVAGYNTSAARGADTFSPFRSGLTLEYFKKNGIYAIPFISKGVNVYMNAGGSISNIDTGLSTGVALSKIGDHQASPEGCSSIGVDLTEIKNFFEEFNPAITVADVISGLKEFLDYLKTEVTTADGRYAFSLDNPFLPVYNSSSPTVRYIAKIAAKQGGFQGTGVINAYTYPKFSGDLLFNGNELIMSDYDNNAIIATANGIVYNQISLETLDNPISGTGYLEKTNPILGFNGNYALTRKIKHGTITPDNYSVMTLSIFNGASANLINKWNSVVEELANI